MNKKYRDRLDENTQAYVFNLTVLSKKEKKKINKTENTTTHRRTFNFTLNLVLDIGVLIFWDIGKITPQNKKQKKQKIKN